jgi:uncharacterized lipoprotein YajG
MNSLISTLRVSIAILCVCSLQSVLLGSAPPLALPSDSGLSSDRTVSLGNGKAVRISFDERILGKLKRM